MQASFGVGPELGKDNWLLNACFLPLIHFIAQASLAIGNLIAAKMIPAWIPVKHVKVWEVEYFRRLDRIIFAQSKRPRAALRVKIFRFVKNLLEVWDRIFINCIRFIKQTPCQNRRMVLIAFDQITNLVNMAFMQLLEPWPFEEGLVQPAKKSSSGHFKADCRHFISQQEAFLIRDLVNLLVIWIMRCPERVCANPFHQGKVFLFNI